MGDFRDMDKEVDGRSQGYGERGGWEISGIWIKRWMGDFRDIDKEVDGRYQGYG